MSGAVFADAGTLFDVGDIGSLNPNNVVADDGTIRTSVGVSVIWDSPLGPLRADIAQALTKDENDKTQIFRFGAATQF
jgi:outer membrane protein insertion porin family